MPLPPELESGRGPRRREVRAAVLAATAAALILAFLVPRRLLEANRHWDYNAVRLARSFVLAAGEPLYAGPASGAILDTIYGPIGAVAYLPVTVLRAPAPAVLAGQVLAGLYVFLPAAWLLLRRSRGRRLPALLAFLAFAALACGLRSLAYVSFTIHVDAPALGLGLLAVGAVSGARAARPRRWQIAATLAVLAVWTKLVLLPLPAALALWAAWSGGRRRLATFLGYLALAAAAVSAVVIACFGPLDNLVLNLWTVPASHTLPGLSRLAAGVRGLLVEEAAAWILWLAAAGLRWLGGGDLRRDPVWAFGLTALLTAPLAVMARLKIGGDVNAHAYVSIFLVTGALLSLAGSAPRLAAARRLLAILAPAASALLLAVRPPETLAGRTATPAPPPHQLAWEYATRHPGEVYFPRLTLASLLAEGRVYHQMPGLVDRRIAGIPTSRRHLLAHLPERLEAVAFYDNAFRCRPAELGLPEFSRPTRDPELPGFIVFRRADLEASDRSDLSDLSDLSGTRLPTPKEGNLFPSCDGIVGATCCRVGQYLAVVC